MKKYLITGLAILLPVTLTIILITFFINLLTEPFLGISKALLGHYGLLNTGFLFFTASQFQTFISQLLILIVLLGITVLVGAITRWFFFRTLLSFWDNIIHRIPVVRSIYKACQDVIQTIFTSKTSAFKQVVMLHFPSPESQTIGLVTRDSLPEFAHIASDLLVVFVPTTPNPTSGFLTIVKKEDVIPLDMSVEDAFKYVVSCGMIMPSFRTESKPADLLLKPQLVRDAE